jgi:hypothetical protein
LRKNTIQLDAVELRQMVDTLEKGLFGDIREFDGYSRVHFVASDADLAKGEIPAAAAFTGVTPCWAICLPSRPLR